MTGQVGAPTPSDNFCSSRIASSRCGRASPCSLFAIPAPPRLSPGSALPLGTRRDLGQETSPDQQRGEPAKLGERDRAAPRVHPKAAPWCPGMPRGVRAGAVRAARGPAEHSVPGDHPLGHCASTATGKIKPRAAPRRGEKPRDRGQGRARRLLPTKRHGQRPRPPPPPPCIPSARYLTPRGNGIKRSPPPPPSRPAAPQPLCSPPGDSGTKRRAPRTPRRPRGSPPSEGSPARGHKPPSPRPRPALTAAAPQHPRRCEPRPGPGPGPAALTSPSHAAPRPHWLGVTSGGAGLPLRPFIKLPGAGGAAAPAGRDRTPRHRVLGSALRARCSQIASPPERFYPRNRGSTAPRCSRFRRLVALPEVLCAAGLAATRVTR